MVVIFSSYKKEKEERNGHSIDYLLCRLILLSMLEKTGTLGLEFLAFSGYQQDNTESPAETFPPPGGYIESDVLVRHV